MAGDINIKTVIIKVSAGEVTSSMHRADRATRRLNRSLNSLHLISNTVRKALYSMVGVLIAFNLLITLPERIIMGLGQAFLFALRSLEQFQSGVVATQGILATVVQFAGKASENFRIAGEAALAVNQELLREAARTPATLEQLRQGFQALIGAGGLEYVKNLREAVKLNTLLVNSTLALTVGQDASRQIATEIRAIFEGQARAGAQLARFLGVQEDRFKRLIAQARENKNLYEVMKQLLEGFDFAAVAFGNTLEGIKTSFQEIAAELGRAIITPLATDLQKAAIAFRDRWDEIKQRLTGIVTIIASILLVAFRNIRDRVFSIGDGIQAWERRLISAAWYIGYIIELGAKVLKLVWQVNVAIIAVINAVVTAADNMFNMIFWWFENELLPLIRIAGREFNRALTFRGPSEGLSDEIVALGKAWGEQTEDVRDKAIEAVSAIADVFRTLIWDTGPSLSQSADEFQQAVIKAMNEIRPQIEALFAPGKADEILDRALKLKDAGKDVGEAAKFTLEQYDLWGKTVQDIVREIGRLKKLQEEYAVISTDAFGRQVRAPKAGGEEAFRKIQDEIMRLSRAWVEIYEDQIKAARDAGEKLAKAGVDAWQKYIDAQEKALKVGEKNFEDSINAHLADLGVYVDVINKRLTRVRELTSSLHGALQGAFGGPSGLTDIIFELRDELANLERQVWDLEVAIVSAERLRDFLAGVGGGVGAVLFRDQIRTLDEAIETLKTQQESSRDEILKTKDAFLILGDAVLNAQVAFTSFANALLVEGVFDKAKAVLALTAAWSGFIQKISGGEDALQSVKKIVGEFIIAIGTALVQAGTASLFGNAIGGWIGALFGNPVMAAIAIAAGSAMIGIGQRMSGGSAPAGAGGAGAGGREEEPTFAFEQAQIDVQQSYLGATNTMLLSANMFAEAFKRIDSAPAGEVFIQGGQQAGGITNVLVKDVSSGKNLSASMALGKALYQGG